tara:strand:+ start:26198 stop:30388 length:4191 start_codon:yes stop_codon:yes gene_type:complete
MRNILFILFYIISSTIFSQTLLPTQYNSNNEIITLEKNNQLIKKFSSSDHLINTNFNRDNHSIHPSNNENVSVKLSKDVQLKSLENTYLEGELQSGSDCIYYDDFSNSSNWNINHDQNSCSLDWQIGTGLQSLGDYPIETIQSTTYFNGCALIDSDLYGGLTGGADVEDSWITTSYPLDFSSLSNPIISFETYYQSWTYEKCWLVLSTDGVNWPELTPESLPNSTNGIYEVFPDISGVANSSVPWNPTVVSINVADFAANQDQVWVRFHWTGSWGFSWFVDDLCISNNNENDLVMNWGAISNTNEGHEYGRTPINQMNDISLFGEIFNWGSETQTNITLYTDLYNSVGDWIGDGEYNTTDPNYGLYLWNEVDELYSDYDNSGYLYSGEWAMFDLGYLNTDIIDVDFYSLNFCVSSSEELSQGWESFWNNDLTSFDNCHLREFEITNDVYSLDGIGVYSDPLINRIGTATFNNTNTGEVASDGLIMMSYYELSQQTNISDVTLLLDSYAYGSNSLTTSGGNIVAYIYDTENVLSGSFNSDNYIASSNLYTITQADINNGYVTLPFNSLVSLLPDSYYVAIEMNSNYNQNDIYILDDETIPQPFDASLIYISADQIYSNPNAAAIRINTGIDTLTGCTDPLACNYDINANSDDGTCIYLNEPVVDLTTGTWIMDADFGCDGIYDVSWLTEYSSDNSLIYEAEGTVLNGFWNMCQDEYVDTDEEGNYLYIGLYESDTFAGEIFIWDEILLEYVYEGCWIMYNIEGCTDVSALNFCEFCTIDDESCQYSSITGCTDLIACNYNLDAVEDDGSCEYFNDQIIDLTLGPWIMEADFECDGIYDVIWVTEYSSDGSLLYDPGDGTWLNGLWNMCGNEYVDTDDQYTYLYNGVFNGQTFEGSILLLDEFSNEITLDGGCWIMYYAVGCTDELACNYDENVIEDDGSCFYPISNNYDCDGNCIVNVDCNSECGGDAIEDECGICDNDMTNDCIQDCLGVWGGDALIDECGICDNDITNDCTQDCLGVWGGDALIDECGICDNDMTNDCTQDCFGVWGGDAIIDDCGVCNGDNSSCIIEGCMDEFACNYNYDADEDDGSCYYAQDNFDCEGNCIINVDCAGVCGGNAVLDDCGICNGDNSTCTGCTEELACNYDPTAIINSGDCEYAEEGLCIGCTEELACNYSINAVISDSSCEYESCAGCTDSYACNYDSTATIDNNSICEYPDEYYDCNNNCLNDLDSDEICDEIDECIGEYDNCGICNGPGDIYDCGCDEIEDGTCDCEGNLLDCFGICGGDAIIDECGECDGEGPVEYYDCDGNCLIDTDDDGICDEIDNCPGVYNPNQEDIDNNGIGDSCDGSDLEENGINRSLIKVTDILGREINLGCSESILLYIYNDGYIEKHYCIK